MTPFHKMHGQRRIAEVNAYRIYCVGNGVGWDCTAQEIADELGLDRSTVCRICKKRGWKTARQVEGGKRHRAPLVFGFHGAGAA